MDELTKDGAVLEVAVGLLKTGIKLLRLVLDDAVELAASSDMELPPVVGVLPSSEDDTDGTAERSSLVAPLFGAEVSLSILTGIRLSRGTTTEVSFLTNAPGIATLESPRRLLPFFLVALSFFPYNVEPLDTFVALLRGWLCTPEHFK